MDNALRFVIEDRELPAILVGDATMFHDMFRSAYGTKEIGDWFLAYLSARRGFDKFNRIVVTPSAVLKEATDALERLRKSGEHGIPAQSELLTALASSVEAVTTNPTVSPKYAPLYVAKMRWDLGVLPFVITSCSHDTMKERVQSAGLEMGIEGFTPVMSSRRLERGTWFIHAKLESAFQVLATLDPLFSDVSAVVGPPPSPAVSSSEAPAPAPRSRERPAHR